jgi:hypothetical protein
MEMVIAEVRKLDMFVEKHDAGDYNVRREFGFLHTLNWTNCNKNYVVSNVKQPIIFYFNCFKYMSTMFVFTNMHVLSLPKFNRNCLNV